MSYADWFGGSETKQLPGASGYVSDVSDWAKNLTSGSLDFAGKSAKRKMKAWDAGNYDSDPALSSEFAPIRDMYATSVREGERAGQMGVGAKWGADNPALAQRVTQLNEERARESEGQAMTRMIPALEAQNAQQFGDSANRRTQEEALQLSGLSEAMKGWIASFYQQQKGGIFNSIANLAEGAGSVAGGLNAGGAGSGP